MYNDPWAKFSTRSTPKIRDSPLAIKKRNIAAVNPLSACANRNDGSITSPRLHAYAQLVAKPPSESGEAPLRGLVHEPRGIDVRDRLHDRERIFRVLHHLPVELTAIGLVVLLADRLLADRRVDGEADERLRDLLGFGAVRLLDRLREELHAEVALDRPRRGIFVLRVLRQALDPLPVRRRPVLPVE